MSSTKILINKFLVQAGAVASRRQAEALLKSGKVGIESSELGRLPADRVIGYRVDPDKDRVFVNGKLIEWQLPQHVYLMMNKPVGYVCTRQDKFAKQTVFDLLPAKYKKSKLFSVGRLDKDSEGLLLLTNDGDWANKLMHPRYQKEKEYLVLVRGKIGDEKIGRLTAGILFNQKTYKMASLEKIAGDKSLVEKSKTSETYQWYRVMLREGKKRQIRLMFEKVGGQVVKLQRVRIGKYRLGELGLGAVAEITQ